MRARVEVSKYVRSSIFMAASAVAAFAIQAPAALARPGDASWDTSPRFQAERRIDRWDGEEARPRRRAGRSDRRARRYSHRQRRLTSRSRARTPAHRAARRKMPARVTRAANARVIAAPPAAEIVPLEQRSIVATHPLLPDPSLDAGDPVLAGNPASLTETAAPRCRSAHRSSFALAIASFGRDFKASEPAMIEGAWPHCRSARHPQSNWQLASLGPALPAPQPSASPSLSGGSIRWVASAGCLASPLRAVLAQVAATFGPLTVNSTCRSRSHNRRVGGATRSYHLTGNAVDFRVRGSYGSVHGFLAHLRSVGGLKHYGSGVFHIDTGPRRTWGARRTRLARR